MEDYLSECGGRDIPFTVSLIIWHICNINDNCIMQLHYKEEICETMLLHDVLIRRKSYLDALMEGLNNFSFKRVICANPSLFEPLFVAEPITSEQVKNLVKTLTPPGNNTIKQRILHTVGLFIDSCNEKGMYYYIKL